MKVSSKIEPTLLVEYKNEKIAVSTLPDEIRHDIETMDQFTQDKLNAIYEVEKCDLAIKMKRMQINAAIAILFAKEKEQSAKIEETMDSPHADS